MKQRHLAGFTFIVVGVLLAGVQLQHAIDQMETIIDIVVDGVPFMMLGLSLAFVGYWIATTEKFEEDIPRISSWTAGGIVLFASVTALMLFSQSLPLGSASIIATMTVDGVTVGAIAGTLVGLYDAQSQQHFRELQGERERTEEFATKAADLNNYGRALSQASSLDEIAAYCIQGISSLLSYDDTAFVEVGPADETIVSSTISDIPETDIRTIARRAIDTEDVVSTDADDGLTSHSTLSVRIESATPDMGVLVTMCDNGGDMAPEDENLLELLASHASMVLDRVYQNQ